LPLTSCTHFVGSTSLPSGPSNSSDQTSVQPAGEPPAPLPLDEDEDEDEDEEVDEDEDDDDDVDVDEEEDEDADEDDDEEVDEDEDEWVHAPRGTVVAVTSATAARERRVCTLAA
jgi:hypothetical protein